MTPPITPPGCDLRDYPWMPIDCTRLLTSETWILGSSDEKVAALTLWCKSWHQVPAASLPDNDRILSVLSEAGAVWPEVREHALRGWVKCTDGRLYHPVVAEKAEEAWKLKLARKARTEAARAAKAAHRTEQRASSVTESVTTPVTEIVTGSNGTERTVPDQRRKEGSKILRDSGLPYPARAALATTKPTSQPAAQWPPDPHPSAITARVGQVVARLEGRAQGQPFMTARGPVRSVTEQLAATAPKRQPKQLAPAALAEARAKLKTRGTQK